MKHTYEHAIVLGASMAGLMNAAVLARHSRRVTLLERDVTSAADGGAELPLSDPGARKGAPQGRHVHGFWPRGMQVLDALLPDFRAQLLAAGAVGCDSSRDFVWHQFGASKLRVQSDMPATLATRPFLERQLRQRVLALPNVSLCEGVSVEGLCAQQGGRDVHGVRLVARDGLRVERHADLVVDATGRAGQCARWLQELGMPAVSEQRVSLDVRYVTRMFARVAGAHALAHVIAGEPPAGKRGGVAFAVERGRWVVSLSGFAGEEPPEDLAGFTAYARSLPHPAIGQLIRASEPLGEAARFKFPGNVRRHYEKLRAFPRGLLVTGDALASFNPAYGQGMTVAALEAEALALELASSADPNTLARRFFRRAARIIDVPWQLTTGEDLRYPEARGPRPAALGPINAYVARMHRAAAVDEVVCQAFLRVAGFEASPPSLFAPHIAYRILRHGARPPLPAADCAAE